MENELQKLKELYFLEPKKVDEIAERIILNNTFGITSVKNPQVIILGGQPGSGKGELITQAQVVLGINTCLLYTSPSPRDRQKSRMPSSA